MVIFYFILGMFMETLSMMVATVPIIAPIMFKAGYDPVWFGIMIIILMELAMITPPVGINLYVVQGLRKRGRIDDVIIGASPFVITMMLMLLILAVWPDIALWLPQMAANAAGPGARALSSFERDHDVAGGVALGRGAGRDDAGRVVFLDDQRPAAAGGEIGAAQRPAFPASRARRRNRPGASVRATGSGRLDRDALRHAAALAQARADELDRHQLDRLVGAGAMAVGPLVLLGRRPPRDARPCAHRSGRPAPAPSSS